MPALYAFEQDEARALQEFARKLLLSPTAVPAKQSGYPGKLTGSARIRSTGTAPLRTYLIATTAPIPAAVESGGFLTPGSGDGELLRKTEGEIKNAFADDGTTPRTVTVYNSTMIALSGSLLEPLLATQDTFGTLWLAGSSGGTLCERLAALPEATQDQIDNATHILGTDGTDCFRIPVADCDPMLAHE